MTNENKALTVKNPEEVQMERFALLVCFGPEDGDGKGLSIPKAAVAMGIHRPTAYTWWRTKYVQDFVRENMSALRAEAKLHAAKHVKGALDTLVKATESPAYTTPMVNAAKALLTFAYSDKEDADTNVGIIVNVGTGLPTDLVERQQARQQKAEQRTIAGTFRVLPVD